MREPGPVTRRVTEDALTAVGIEPASISIIGSREAIYETISRGLGCSIVSAREAPRQSDVRVLPFSGNAPVIHEYLYFLKERKDTCLVRAFLDCLDLQRAPAPTKKTDAFIAKVTAMGTAATRQGRNLAVFRPPLPARCMQSFALFDLDYTLLPIDGEYGWSRFLVTQGAMDRNKSEQANERWMRGYRDGMLDFARYVRFSLGLLAQHPRTWLDAWRVTLVREAITPVVLPSAWQLADTHLRAGDLCCITTAMHRYLAEPVTAASNVPHLLAVEGETLNGQSDGAFTGNPLGTTTFGAGKIVRVTEWLVQRGQRMMNFTRTVFYSDSRNDLPLLEVVSYPVAVSPDSILRAAIESRGWPIVELFPA